MIRCTKQIFLVILLYATLTAQQRPVSIEHLYVDDGLSNPFVSSDLKERYGLMWFGTYNGLNCYDGYTIREYRPVPGDSTSLSHLWVSALYEDHNGQLWITTRGGLNRYDRVGDKFKRYYSTWGDSTTISNDLLLSVF